MWLKQVDFFFDFPESDYTTNHHQKTAAKNQGILPTCLSLNEVFFFGSKNFQGGFPNVGIRGGMGDGAPEILIPQHVTVVMFFGPKNPAIFGPMGELLLVGGDSNICYFHPEPWGR